MYQSDSIHDVLVIGGGINGTGIAADAAGRGLDVVLCEKSDLAGGTSAWSTKLIHGGLRYLEFYEFGLVRKALQEREVLTRAAKHIIQPMAFQIPQLANSRHPLLIRLGLFLYDNLARRKQFKGSRSIKYDSKSVLSGSIARGFEYWDAQVDDSRLVVSNALQAKSKGASVLTTTECVALRAEADTWIATVQDTSTGIRTEIRARSIVNASGPWVSSLLKKLSPEKTVNELRLVKGSHIVVPKMYEGGTAYMLQHHDGRVIFVIPYQGKYTLIGTTEEAFNGDLDKPEISHDEVNYLLSIVNQYFKKPITRSDVVYTYAGVRPLMEEEGIDASKVSRDFHLELDPKPHPLLSVYGGKVTTYRVLAEAAVDQLADSLNNNSPAWTKEAILPGGDFDDHEGLGKELTTRYSWLAPDLINRWLYSYGTLSFKVAGSATSMAELGQRFGYDLYQREVDYLCREEWAKSADDILWRRSKLGYFFSAEETEALDNYIKLSYPANKPQEPEC
ncbi:MAG: glycerol-3-phosphate dehydrogenase [Pseudohongiellaceae bacterium]